VSGAAQARLVPEIGSHDSMGGKAGRSGSPYLFLGGQKILRKRPFGRKPPELRKQGVSGCSTGCPGAAQFVLSIASDYLRLCGTSPVSSTSMFTRRTGAIPGDDRQFSLRYSPGRQNAVSCSGFDETEIVDRADVRELPKKFVYDGLIKGRSAGHFAQAACPRTNG